MNTDEVKMSGFTARQPIGVVCTISTRKEKPFTITFSRGTEFVYGLTNPLKVATGETIGEMNRRHFHEALDECFNAWLGVTDE